MCEREITYLIVSVCLGVVGLAWHPAEEFLMSFVVVCVFACVCVDCVCCLWCVVKCVWCYAVELGGVGLVRFPVGGILGTFCDCVCLSACVLSVSAVYDDECCVCVLLT